MKKVAILQSNYIPWKGYFDIIATVDEFIIYDEMQFTRRDWRNRNKIKISHGTQWLSIPVKVKGKYNQKICETITDGDKWRKKHWHSLLHNYQQSPYFSEVATWLEPLYLGNYDENLSQINRSFIDAICKYLSIKTVISNSWDYDLVDGKTERIVSLCLQANATEYVTGPAAKGYLNESVFAEHGIKLTWFDYNGYSEYPQLWDGFTHNVTILDLLFNCGRDSIKMMKHV